MIKINTTQKDFFENNKYVVTSAIFDGDIVEIEFTDGTVEFIALKVQKIFFSVNTTSLIDLLNFLGNGLKKTLLYGGGTYFDLNRYQIVNDDIEVVFGSLNSQYFTRFDEIKIIKEIEIKNFKRLGSKK